MSYATVAKLPIPAAEPTIEFAETYVLTDPAAARQAMLLTEFFQQAVAPAPANPIHFDLGRAIELVAASFDMALARKVDQAVVSTGEPLHVAIDSVLRLVRSVIDVPLHHKDIDQLRTAVAGAFVGLAAQQHDAWLAWGATQAARTVWHYNLNVVVQSEETGDFVYAMPIGLSIEARLPKAAVLAMQAEDVVDVSIRIESIKAIQFLRDNERERTAAPRSQTVRTARTRSGAGFVQGVSA